MSSPTASCKAASRHRSWCGATAPVSFWWKACTVSKRARSSARRISSATWSTRENTRAANRTRRSNIAAVDLFAQALDHLVDLRQVRIDLERAAEHVQRALLVAELLQDHAEPRHRAEVPRLKLQHLTDVLHRLAEFLAHVANGGAPIPGLDVIRLDLDDGVEQLDGKVEIVGIDRRLGPGHEQVGGVAAGGKPERPDAVLDLLGAFGVGGS